VSEAQQPAWWQRGAIYQIYPRSFADADGDGVGDLRGIIAHLDHLNDGTPDSLGVEAIWLSPFYRSPMADYGYDVSDYCDVDRLFGTLVDFDDLVREAHARGIRVVIDFVPNHSSDRHPWFEESRSSRDNPKRDWYVWRDGGGPDERPNDWVSNFRAVGPAWTWDERTEQWYLHSFLPEQPDLNWDNPEVEAALLDAMRFWLDRGVDGFRLDVIHGIAKDPELRSNDGSARVHHEDWQPTIHERLERMRAMIDEYDDRILVGEVYLLDLQRVVAYVNSGRELHLAHNFTFVKLPWDAAAFRQNIDDWEAAASEVAWPAWFLANHDHPRTASRFDDPPGIGPARARAVLLLLYALRGTPFVYQGEELGLPDAEVPPERVVDVDGRDPERAPIPWEPPSRAGQGAGFTDGEPWLPLVADAERLNVATQRDDPASAFSLARRLAWLRRAEPALQVGGQRMLDLGPHPPDLLAWLRALDGGPAWLVIVNFAAQERAVPAPGDLPGRGVLEVSTVHGRAEEGSEVALDGLRLAPGEAVLVRLG
jgi:alpha-glucosidase